MDWPMPLTCVLQVGLGWDNKNPKQQQRIKDNVGYILSHKRRHKPPAYDLALKK